MKIKVCGITVFEQLQQLASLKIDYAGFIFHPASPRYVLNSLKAEEVAAVKNIKKVGVFVNSTYDEILLHIKSFDLQLVQLHGEESPELCAALQKQVPVIKVFRVTGNEDANMLVKPYEYCTDYFLFDTLATDYGGTGKKFNWSFFEKNNIDKPYFLSGGIGLNDLEAVKELYQKNPFYAIDVNSKFETSPGNKNMNDIKKLINEHKL